MAISYNTGANANANNATSCNITIPSGVLINDVMILNVQLFTETGTAPTVSFSGAGGSWSLVSVSSGTNPEVATAGSSIWSYGYAYYRVATAGDPGATLTVSETGSASGSTWFAMTLASYTGANTSSPIDTAAGANNANVGDTVTCPTLLTNTASDWAVYVGGGGVNSSATLTGPSGSTSRENVVSSAGIGASSCDSNGSVGAAGTSIGGGKFTSSSGSAAWMTGFTIGLAPPGGAAPTPENPTPPRIPHPLWWQLLEVAYERADWQAQGVASPVPATWRLMDGVNGRPGTGSTGTQPPASATANSGNFIPGLSFYVTQGGMWFQGYWWYVAASGGQSTSAQKFALWTDAPNVTSGSLVVPGSVVTSGTLATGWNWVPLPQAIQLSLYGIYVAATTANSGPFPETSGQFASGNPYQGGITNGPLTCFSDTNGTNSAPSGYISNGCSTTAGSDPSVSMPADDAANAGDLFWLDVQVTNQAPAGYNGSYRLWPNTADADFETSADAAANYVLATEFTLAQACVVNAIWYFVPNGMGASGNQWATSADIWRVRDQVRVATQPNPVWVKPFTGGIDGQSNSGRWVYTQLPGTVTLPAGDYKVSVYNSNGSPNGWSAKRLGYWQANNQSPAGVYQTQPPGAAGITNGPIAAPTTPAASAATDFINGSITEPGQSTFQTGPPNQYPNIYVGTPSNLFQNYWVDIEVTPASTWQPDAPDLPARIPHPLWLKPLLEVAAERIDNGTVPPGPVTPAAGAPAVAVAAPAPVPAVTANAGVAAVAAAVTAPVASATATAGVPAVLVVAPGATVADTAIAGAALVLAAVTAATTAETVTAGVAVVLAAVTGPSVAETVTAGVGIIDAVAPGASAQTSGSQNANAGAAAVAAAVTSATTAVTVTAGVAAVAAAAPGAAVSTASGTNANAGAAAAAAAVAAATLAITATAGVAAVGAVAADIPPKFTVGTLTAGTAAGGSSAASLTATDTRAGGPQ